MDVDKKLQELDAYEQIRRVAADYCHGVDKHDRDRFASVWHQDAEGLPFPGREAILATLDGIWGAVSETHHWACNQSVRVDGDEATGLADVDVVMQTPDGKWYRTAASYEDVYAGRDGEWRLLRRGTQIHHQIEIPEP